MAWLVHEGRVLASLERAESLRDRAIGLLGRRELEGVLLIENTKSVHTIGMKFPIDVAFCDGEMRVIRIVTLPQHRVSKYERHAAFVVEAEAGRFRHWQVAEGDQLEVRGDLDGAVPFHD